MKATRRAFLSITVFLCMTTLVVILTVPASGNTLFSDLGPPGNVYDCCLGWIVAGTGTFGTSFTAANLFNSGVGGSVSRIDLAVGHAGGLPTFYASIWTDLAGLPGSQVVGARWDNLISTETFGNCCGLVTITSISGVTLSAGTDYFMILGPESISDNSDNAWNSNSTGANGLDLFSTDGGITWNSNGSRLLGAFDVIGPVPGPSSFLLFGLGIGLLGALGEVRRKMHR